MNKLPLILLLSMSIALSKEIGQKLTIEADRVDFQNETATYEGNVNLKQHNFELNADSLRINRRSNGVFIEANRNIKFIRHGEKNFIATGDKVEFFNNILTLSGKIKLLQGEQVVEGDSLRINFNDNSFEINSKSRVKIILNLDLAKPSS